jgi:branched-chain amino acid transport system permease protein
VGQFIQLVVDGLSNGSIFAVLALAIVLVNQATGLINFAQGGMAVFSAYMTWYLTEHGLPLVVAIVLSALASFVLGGLLERFVIRRFERGDPDTAVVVTIGLLTLITGVCGWVWTYNNKQFPSLFSLHTVKIFGAAVSFRSIGTFLVIVAIMLSPATPTPRRCPGYPSGVCSWRAGASPRRWVPSPGRSSRPS